jgi:protein-tyrosine phosphatase
VKLKTPIDGSDYINASPITLKSRFTASLNQQDASINPLEQKYIASQGPKEGQFSHFWNMVMQQTVGDAGIIIMLTECFEGNREKCAPYFPLNMDSPTLYLDYHEAEITPRPQGANGDPFADSDTEPADTNGNHTDDLTPTPATSDSQDDTSSQNNLVRDNVTLLSLTNDEKSHSILRTLRLRVGSQEKTIYHYFFASWPDYGAPVGEDRRALLDLVKQISTRAESIAPETPRFVHCSAGVGRTGTYIALDYLLRELAHGHLEIIPSNPVSRPNSSGARTQSSNDGSDADALSMNGSLNFGKESTPEPKEDLIFETVNKLREQRMMMVMNEIQYGFLYEVLREAYVEMYSPFARKEKVVGNGMGDSPIEHGEIRVDNATDADMAEPSPKMAKTGDGDVFLGPRGAAREEKRQIERKVANKEAVEGNKLVSQRADGHSDVEDDPYAAVDPEVVRMESSAKKD